MTHKLTFSHVVLNVVCILTLLLGTFPIEGKGHVHPATAPKASPARLSAFVDRLAAKDAQRAARHQRRVEERRAALVDPVSASWPPGRLAGSPSTPAEQPVVTSQLPPSTILFLPLIYRAYWSSSALITAEAGGIVASPDGRLELTFAPGTVAEATRVTLRPAAHTTLPPRTVDRALSVDLSARELDSGAQVTRFFRPVQVVARYDSAASLRIGAEESRLVLRVRSGSGQSWRSLPSQIDTEADTISAPLLHFSELGLFTTSPFSDVVPVQLAPFVPLTPSTLPLPKTFHTHTAVITYTEGKVWLSSTPDGQGELFTDDTAAITVTHEDGTESSYTYDYYDPGSGSYTSTAPVELSGLFAQGVNTVTIALADTRPNQYGTFGYYLTQARNPYGRLLGGNYPTAIALGQLDLSSGNLLWRENDLAVFGLGPAVAFRRTYNSFDDSSGIFGAGWSSPFDSRLWQYFDGSVEVRRADGQRALFVPSGTGWAPEPGVFDVLERAGDGFVLTEKRSLTEYHYDGGGRLWQIVDRHDNAVQIAYGSDEIQVTDAAGRDYTLHLAAGLVTDVTDPAGRQVSYTYSPAGELLSFTGLRGEPAYYGYTLLGAGDEVGRLAAITDTLGVRVAEVTYDEYGRAWGYSDGVGGTTVVRTQPHEAVLTDAGGYETTVRYDGRWRVDELVDTQGYPVYYAYDGRDLRLSITDQSSHTTRFGYDERGNVTRIANPLSHTLVYTYNQFDQPSQRVDADGAVIDYAYREADLAGVYQSGLLTLTIDYDEAGQIEELENGGGNRLELGYDGYGNVTAVSDTLGNATAYAYDQVGRIVERTDSHSQTVGFGYDVAGSVTSITDSQEMTITYTYDSEGQVRTRTDRLGYTTVYTYEQRGLLSLERDPLGNLTRYSYDERGDLTQVVDARGYTTTYEYDGQRRLERVIDAQGGVTRYLYDPAGRQIGLVNARGYTTTYEYDDAGRRTAKIDPLGNRTEYAYDEMARVIERIDPRRNVTSFEYDEAGNLSQIVDALGNPTLHTYDQAGRRATTLYPDGGEAAYEYDENGRLTTLVDQLNGLWRHEYDELGLEITRTDALSRTTGCGYDANRNLITETDALGNVVVYTYDAENRRTSRRLLANGATWRYEYDALGRLIRETDPTSGTTEYRYDRMGNTVAITDAMGGVTRYEYDGLDRRTAMVDAEGQRTEYEYDAVGNLLVERICLDPMPGPSHGDHLHRVAAQRGAAQVASQSAVGSCISNYTKHYTYDAADRLIVVTDTLGHPTHYEYDAASNRTAITDARGYSTTLDYDPLDRVVTTTNALGDFATVEYDEMGRVVARSDERGNVTRYGYDLLGRQIVVTDALGNLTTWTYDAVSNTLAITNGRGYPTTFGYDALDRQVIVTDALGYTTTMEYDGVGNLVQVRDTRSHVTTYGYDSLGRRVIVTDALGYATSTAYDPLSHRTAVTDALGYVTHWAHDRLGQTLVVTDAEGGVTQYEYDVLGNQIVVTDARGFITTFEYDGESQLRRTVDPLGNSTTYDYDQVGNRVIVTDALGYTTTTVYDPLDRPAIETDALEHSELYFYDQVGNLVEVEDRRGYTTTYQYDALNRAVATTDAEGHTTHTIHDAVGNTLLVTNARGYATTYGYDPLDRQVVVTDALGYTTTTAYDPAGNVVRVVDALGYPTAYSYDPLDRQVVVTDALGYTTTTAYDAVGNAVAITNARGYPTVFAYDGLERQVVVTDALGHTTTTAYDAVGNTLVVTNARGYPTSYGYDPLDRQVVVTDALGYTTTYAYDAVGNLVQARDERGYTTTYAYDPVHNQVAITDALGYATRRAYDPERNIVATTDANEHTTRWAYDGVGHPLAITDPLSGIRLTLYDENYDVTATVNARGYTTTFTYDPLDRQVAVADPLGHTTTTAYDALARTVAITDAEGNATHYAYDPLGRLITVTDALSGVTAYGYDPAGNRVSQTDANNHTTSFEYDPLNRRVRERDPLGNEWEYGYDENGNLVRRTDANGATTQYTYDPLDRRAHVHYPANSSQDVTFTYDPNGNLTRMVDPLGVLLAEYDPLNRLTQVTDQATRSTQYAYDPVGNLTRIVYPNDSAVAYTYDPNDWLETATDPNGNVTRYTYDPNGLVTHVLYGNGTWAESGYDVADRLTGVYVGTPAAGTGLLRSYDYTLDRVGNRVQTVERYTLGQVRTIVRDHQYDDLYRLTETVESYEGPPAEVISSAYTYDPAGNRLTMTTNRPEQGPPGPTVTTEYEYNEANWLLSASTDSESTTYAYDDDGNRVQAARSDGVVETYAYDLENRLVEYRRTGDGADRQVYAQYDGLSRRFAKGTQEGQGNVAWTQYAYHQLTMDPLAEYPQTGPPRVSYSYRGRAGAILAMEEQRGGGEGKEYWFAQDGLGSVAAVTKQDGQSAHEYFYDPYGGIIDGNGRPEDSSNWTDPHNHYLLTGKEWDEVMRLYYFGARYYDPATGVWLTQDVYRGEVEQPLTLHRTLYVADNPINRVDAYGYMMIYANGYGRSGGGSSSVSPQQPTYDNAATNDSFPYEIEFPPQSGEPGGASARDESQDQLGVLSWQPLVEWETVYSGGMEQVWLQGGPVMSSTLGMPSFDISYTDPLYFDDPRILNDGLPSLEDWMLAGGLVAASPLLLLGGLSGCTSRPAPTSTAMPWLTPTPTSTPTPTATPRPTAAASATPWPTPTATATPIPPGHRTVVIEVNGQQMSITYPYEDYLESIFEEEWSDLSQEEVGFRVVLGEVGAERLLKNRYALTEGVGITYTVLNRLDVDVYDPEERGVQHYSGCGPEGDFASCATGQRQDGYYEYNVMGTLLALDPRSVLDPDSTVYNPFFSTYGEEKFAEAADVAYAAYYLAANEIVPDPTGSAIEYIHESSTGPAVFFAPGEFLSDLGVYYRDESKRIPYTEVSIGWNQPPPYRPDPLVYEVP